MVLKRGRFGEFMACSGYPECRNTKKIVKSANSVTVKQDIPLDEHCPVCGKNLAIKARPVRGVHRLQRLPRLQVHQAEDDRGRAVRSAAGTSSRGSRAAERPFTAAPSTRIAISSSGTSRCRNHVPSATHHSRSPRRPSGRGPSASATTAISKSPCRKPPEIGERPAHVHLFFRASARA